MFREGSSKSRGLSNQISCNDMFVNDYRNVIWLKEETSMKIKKKEAFPAKFWSVVTAHTYRALVTLNSSKQCNSLT